MDVQSKTITMLSVEPGAVVAGRYEIAEKVGTGGMGAVFRVVDRHLNNEVVALKLLHPHLAEDEDVFGRFRNEVLVARALSHPHIVRLHDIGKAEQGFHYISMEFVDGYTLKDRIFPDHRRPLPVLSFDEGVAILYQLCAAVAYAHGKGIIHRDLKPANVMMTKNHEVKLSDFGTARIVGMSKNFTQTGQVIGTPDYMSPEQIQGHPLDAKCDIYALGMIAYELATGKKPFETESSVALAFKHMTEPVPKFATPESGIPRWYEELVLVATEKDKDKRFSSVVEMAKLISECSPGVSGTGTMLVGDGTRSFTIGVSSSSTVSGASTATTSGRGTANGGWSIGEMRQPQTMSPPEPQKRTSRSFAPILGLFVVVAAVAWIAYRDFSAVRQFFAGGSPQGAPQEPSTVQQTAPVAAQDQEALREELGRELLAGLDSAPPAGPTVTPEPPTSAASEIVPAQSASTTVADTPVQPEVAPAVLQPTTPIIQLVGSLALREGSKDIASRSVGLDRISQLEWRAKVEGIPNLPKKQLQEQLNQTLSLVALDSRGEQQVGKSEVLLLAQGEGSADLGGKIRNVLRAPKPGDYEIQLRRGEDVLGAMRLNVYRADVAVQTSPGQQEIKVVTDATITQNAAASAGVHDSRQPRPFAGESAPSQAPSHGMPANTLPPAAGMTAPAEVAALATSEVSEPVAVAGAERFVGALTSDAGRRTLTLNLTFSGETITGSASIETLGEFSIDGKLFPRGVELTLTNSEFGFRLSGSRSANSLRGRFSIPARSEKGSWEASK